MAEPKTILYLVGPGGTALNPEEMKTIEGHFRDAGAKLVSVGDSRRAITLDEIGKAAAAIKEPMLVFTHMHGGVKNGKHVVGLTGACDTPASDLFAALTKACGTNRFEIFSTSCHSGSGQGVANAELPKGTVYVNLTTGNEAFNNIDVMNITSTMAKNAQFTNGFSGVRMLSDYLMTDYETRYVPSVTIAGQGTYNLGSILGNRLGKPFSEAEKKRAHDTLDVSFGKAKVSEFISRIESAKSEWNFNVKDYGPAVGVAFAAHDMSKPGLQLPKDFHVPFKQDDTLLDIPMREPLLPPSTPGTNALPKLSR